MKRGKVILFLLAAAFVLIQFFRPVKNVTAAVPDKDIARSYAMPPEVKAILQKACYDCHSNNTVYPWYANVQPLAWWLDAHIRDGKRHLNFDEFLNYPLARQYRKLEETVETVNEGEMPLASYTLTHTNAKLNSGERKLVMDWCEGIRANMRASYPADSLVVKKK